MELKEAEQQRDGFFSILETIQSQLELSNGKCSDIPLPYNNSIDFFLIFIAEAMELSSLRK